VLAVKELNRGFDFQAEFANKFGGCVRIMTTTRETKTQHLLVVSPGNLFGGLRLSPFDADPNDAVYDTDDRDPRKKIHDTTLYFRPPLIYRTSFKYIPMTRGKGREKI
jgi:hypothetical protein